MSECHHLDMQVSFSTFLPATWSETSRSRKLAANLELGGHLGKLELAVLKAANGLAERLAITAVGHRVLESRFGARLALDADDQSFLLQLLHQVVEALAFLSQQVLGRDPAILEVQLGRVLRLHADLLEQTALLKAWASPPRR